MLKYKVGQRVVTYTGFRGEIKRIDIDAERPYVVRKDSGHQWEYTEDELALEVSQSDCVDLQAENERLKAIAATVQAWVNDMEDYDVNSYGLTLEEKSVMRAYQRVLALFSKGETK